MNTHHTCLKISILLLIIFGVQGVVIAQSENISFIDGLEVDIKYPVKTFLSNGFQVFKKNNKYGIADSEERLIIAAAYDKIGWSNGSNLVVDDFIGVKNNDLWGLVNIKSKKIVGAKYNRLKPHKNNFLVASKRNQNNIQRVYGLINTSEKVIVSLKYNFLESAGEYLIAAKNSNGENVYGLIDIKENIIIPFIYLKIKHLSPKLLAIKNKENKFALFSVTGKVLSPFTFDNIAPLKNGWLLIDQKGKKGVLDENGRVLVEPQYKKITVDKSTVKALPFPTWDLLYANNTLLKHFDYDTIAAINTSLLEARMGTNAYVIDFNNNPVIPLKERDFGPFYSGYSVIREGNKYGVIGNYSDLVISVQYDSIIHYQDLFVVYQQNAKEHQWMVFNQNGVKINDLFYDQIGVFSDNFFSVKKNGLWGFINQFGHEVIKAKYDSVFNFNEGVAKVKHKNYFGVIDKYGRTVIPVKYRSVKTLNNNTFLVETASKAGIFVRYKGEIYQTYDQLYIENGFIVEKTHSGKLGLFDPKGQRILSTKFDEIKVAVSNRIHVYKLEQDYGILNMEGGIVLGLENGLQEVGLVHEDFIVVRIHGKYGFIDFNGKLRIANRYDNIGVFTEEMAPIYLLGKWGFIDRIERIKIQPQFDFAGSFGAGIAIVKKGNQFGLINKAGKEVLNVDYQHIVRNVFGNYVTTKNNKAGLVNKKGYEIVFPKFDQITDLGNGKMIISNQGKFGVINEKGISTIPMIYKHLIFHAPSNIYFGMKEVSWEKLTL